MRQQHTLVLLAFRVTRHREEGSYPRHAVIPWTRSLSSDRASWPDQALTALSPLTAVSYTRTSATPSSVPCLASCASDGREGGRTYFFLNQPWDRQTLEAGESRTRVQHNFSNLVRREHLLFESKSSHEREFP